MSRMPLHFLVRCCISNREPLPRRSRPKGLSAPASTSTSRMSPHVQRNPRQTHPATARDSPVYRPGYDMCCVGVMPPSLLVGGEPFMAYVRGLGTADVSGFEPALFGPRITTTPARCRLRGPCGGARSALQPATSTCRARVTAPHVRPACSGHEALPASGCSMDCRIAIPLLRAAVLASPRCRGRAKSRRASAS
jgi:hypothetical protein